MTTEEVPVSVCRGCGRPNDRRTSMGETAADMPGAGMISLCFRCGHIAIFCDDLTLREPNDEEMYAIAGDTKLLKIQAARALAYANMIRERSMKCPHAKSDMTPCYIKDGAVTLCHMPGYDPEGPPTHCVGCERSKRLLDIEKRKLRRGGEGAC